VAILYAGFSGLWILLSDRAVEALTLQPATMTLLSILKGWVFVAVTAALLFVMVKRLVASVASREAKLQTLIHAIPDLVWLKSHEGAYLGCNRAFERMCGAREAELLGLTDHDLFTREQADFFRQKDLEAIAAGTTRENEEWVTQAETGHRIQLEVLKTPIHDASGTPIGVLGIGRDITEHRRLVAERVRLEARLNQAEKMEMVGRFAGGVAHDYNNMLTVILANADLAMEKLGPESPGRKHLLEIQRAARHSTDLTQQLLAFARQQPVAPRLVDLNEAVAGLLEVLGRLVGPDIHVVWTPGPGLWKVQVDPTQLDQVLTNLLVNARDAMGGPGRLDVATSNRTLQEADCADLADLLAGDHVCLSVTDSGCGMAPEVAARIFEPFFTTKAPGKGTGLGLAMVHSAVRQNHGAIRVESELGRGTCFKIFLPRAQA
jgi:PAS domain S-box-containing protein